MMIRAVDIGQTDQFRKYSNPEIAQQKARKYLGKNAIIYRSTRKNKKYMIQDGNSGVWVHFGAIPYEDFTKHKDKKRRSSYISRATGIRGNWRTNPYSPNSLSINILW